MTNIKVWLNWEAAREMDNRCRADKLVRQRAAELRKNPKEGIILALNCYNKQEADSLEQYMKDYHPGVPFFTTWVNFRDSQSNRTS